MGPRSGNLYVADAGNHRVRVVLLPSGRVATVAGSTRGFSQGRGAAARFDTPVDVAVLPGGSGTIDSRLFVADSGNQLVRQSAVVPQPPPASGFVMLTGLESTYIGFRPAAIAVDATNGVLYLAGPSAIWKLKPATGALTVFATGFYPALCSEPTGLAAFFACGLAAGGTIVRFSTATGASTVQATGTGTCSSLAVAADGTRFILDTGMSQLKRVTPAGVTTLYAGGSSPFANQNRGSVDGFGTTARFFNPTSIVLGRRTNSLYITDTDNARIRKVDPSGEVSTLAGSSVPRSAQQRRLSSGVGTTAIFSAPKGLALDAAESTLTFLDGTNGWSFTGFYGSSLTRIDLATLRCTPILSSGWYEPSWGEADMTSRPYAFPLVFDSEGVLYGVEDSYSRYLLALGPAASPPLPPPSPRPPPPVMPPPPLSPPVAFSVTTVAGSGLRGPTEGVGLFAAFDTPAGLSADSAGTLWIADAGEIFM